MKQVAFVRAMVRKLVHPNMSATPTLYYNVTTLHPDEGNFTSAGGAAAVPGDGDAGDDDVCIYATPSTCTDGWLGDVALEYGRTYHVYLALAVCCFGTIANLLNIAVLTRKDMACAPINRILTGIAVADMMIMLEYMPFGYYYYIFLPGKRNFPYWASVYMLCHVHFTQVMHTTSICLTLTLAIWRYLAIGYPNQNQRLCSERRCTLGIGLSYLLPIVLCVPTYLTFQIQSTTVTEHGVAYVLYHVGLSELARKHDYLVINFWLYAVVLKLLPCCILTAISWWLVRTLFVAKKRKQVLRGYNACMTIESGGALGGGSGGGNGARTTKAERRADRTTKMLVAVVVLFLLTEFPQGIFGLLIGLKGSCFFINCYHKFGEPMDLLALLNGSINFILYCWMNRMFRITFGQLFKSKVLAKWVPPANSEIYTTSDNTGTSKM